MDLYLTGRVTATYLSTLMAHKFNIEAVEIQTSATNQPRHHQLPKIQVSRTYTSFIVTFNDLLYMLIILYHIIDQLISML